MRTNNNPHSVWEEYQRGIAYNRHIGYYDTVAQNENFYIGKQWEGVNAPDLDKPVINVLGRVVNYLMAMVCGEDIGVSLSPLQLDREGEAARTALILSQQLGGLLEQNNMLYKAKDLLRNAAVEGDCYLHFYFDPDARADADGMGTVRAEILEGRQVFFSNPLTSNKENQSYILLSARRPVEEVRAQMRASGQPAEQIMRVKADSAGVSASPFEPKEHVTVLCRYFMRNGSVWVQKTTQDAVVMPETNTGYTRYPIASMCWEEVKGSYRGQAAVTGLLPNQIAINKLFAMAIKYQKELAFPKIFFDRTKIDRWTNKIGAIAVNGDPTGAVVRYSGGADMSGQVLQLVDRLIAYTRDMMGASDAAFGNMRPDNTSAIIELQRSTALPLDLKRRAFYCMMEEAVRVLLDICATDYGVRQVLYLDEQGVTQQTRFDFASIRRLLLELTVEVGQSPYFSEYSQMATLDSLYQKGIITDAIDYLEAVPDSRLRNKKRLIAQLKQKRAGMEE